jgi:myosin heavy subunit
MTSWIGANVWIMVKSPNDTWCKGIVTNASPDDNNKEWTFEVDVDNLGPHSIKTVSIDSFNLEFESVKRREVESIDFSKISDMTALTYLNEPEIIECLRRRYEIDLLYTATGPILVAVNPYKHLPIYDEDVLEIYFNEGNARGSPSFSLPPHVFQISDNAYRRMFIDKFNPDKRENQSILVNGESGVFITYDTLL